MEPPCCLQPVPPPERLPAAEEEADEFAAAVALLPLTPPLFARIEDEDKLFEPNEQLGPDAVVLPLLLAVFVVPAEPMLPVCISCCWLKC